jgi:hypothetical protein
MRLIKEKRGNEIVKNMNSNFAKETNQRDEDAEMQKFIEEQLRVKKEADLLNSKSQAPHLTEKEREYQEYLSQALATNEQTKKFKRPEDALFDVPKYLIENQSKHKSEESLSEQMLSGIPEVDLGVEERMRNIEETERAKQSLTNIRAAIKSGKSDSQYAPQNMSVNFVQHKRFDDALINPEHMIKPRMPRTNPNAASAVNQPVVGDAPKHELLQARPSSHKPKHPNSSKKGEKEGGDAKSDSKSSSGGLKRPHTSANPASTTEKASDDYCLERFKKNMRFNRNSKIKIA